MAPKKEGTKIDTSGYDYPRVKVRGADGKPRYSTGRGDAIFRAFLVLASKSKDIGTDLAKVVKANKLNDRIDPASFTNIGQFRMSLGNMLRGLVRKGTPVTIGALTVSSLDQKVDVPEFEEGPAPARKSAKAKSEKAPKAAGNRGGRKPAKTAAAA